MSEDDKVYFRWWVACQTLAGLNANPEFAEMLPDQAAKCAVESADFLIKRLEETQHE